MPIPDGTRAALAERLDAHRRQRWPQLSDLSIRYRAMFAYLDGATTEDDSLSLCRLRYLGSPDNWGFAIYLASKDGYEDSILPTGSFTGTPEQALDCTCGLYLDIAAWTDALDNDPQDSRDNF
ncbi:MAG: hypothetical protein M3083_25545 [Actinomycetota bacterium]|nr:hypothetical protein [Actinomycetota bacterium]MDQ6946481.1 hypothetical protein [Actinomycetota bacterium]